MRTWSSRARRYYDEFVRSDRWRRLIDGSRPSEVLVGERPQPLLLRGQVDEPAPGALVPRTQVTVRGWSAWGQQPALAAAVRVNGVLVGVAVVGSEPRPDVAEALTNPSLVGAGWRLEADLSGLGDQNIAELTVSIWADLAAPPVELDPIAIRLHDDPAPTVDESEPPEFTGYLDLPRPDDPVSPVAFRVEGWALHRTDPISSIDVLINGRRVGRARTGIVRPDVTTVHPQPEAGISGFEFWADLAVVPTTTSHLKLQLVARTSQGRPQVVLERTCAVADADVAVQRSSRDAVLEVRRRRIASLSSRPRVDGLDLVVFTHQLGYGGAQLWLDEVLGRSGAGTDFACTVIASGDGPLRDSLERRGIPVHVTPRCPVDDIEAYEGRITELTALVQSGGHNAALVNTVSCFIGADVTTRLGLPTVWAIHESLPPKVFLIAAHLERPDSAVWDAIKRGLASADALIFEAEATRQLYAPWAGADRAIVVPYGVDTRTIEAYCEQVSRAAARADSSIPDDAKVLLVMGTIEPRKAQTLIAQAFALIQGDYPNWTLVFVGDSETPYSAGLKDYLQLVGLEDHSRVVPVVEDTYRWYRAADVLLSASDMESLPRSALEAMCFGVPVLSTSVFGLPELLEDGTTGFLFEANDLDAAVAALRRVLGLDPAQLAAIGQNGRRLVVDRYDSAGYVADCMALLDGFSHDRELTPKEILAQHGRVALRTEQPSAAG